jgi:hypothetical protein
VISRTKTGGMIGSVKTNDIKTYEVVIEGDSIRISIDDSC